MMKLYNMFLAQLENKTNGNVKKKSQSIFNIEIILFSQKERKKKKKERKKGQTDEGNGRRTRSKYRHTNFLKRSIIILICKGFCEKA